MLNIEEHGTCQILFDSTKFDKLSVKINIFVYYEYLS